VGKNERSGTGLFPRGDKVQTVLESYRFEWRQRFWRNANSMLETTLARCTLPPPWVRHVSLRCLRLIGPVIGIHMEQSIGCYVAAFLVKDAYFKSVNMKECAV
jgi:hypothetical protein